MFKELDKEKVSVVNEKIYNYWDEHDILNKSNQGKDKNFVFYDGPATANGMPGIHHMMAKLLKDSVCKYYSMNGYKVDRRVGWDTHGLPVEVAVEKALGFSGKGDIEKYGIEAFNKKCKDSVLANEAAFVDFTHKMGQLIDTKNPYITYDNSFIETEWWILKEYYKAGLIYEGFKILPYCPRCGTGLASHEVAQGYKNVSVNSVYIPFKLKDEDSYFLVWTTTPWTLIANVALCVNPEETYVKVESKGYKFILAEKLVEKVIGSEYKVIEKYSGKDLEYKEYEQLIPSIKMTKKAFIVTNDTYVTMEDGTGIVHMAPAFGQDDYDVCLRYDLELINPVNSEGKYKEGLWKDRFVLDPELEIDIIKYLKENDKLFKKQKIEHNYPHCWRCSTPLMYYASPSLYIKTTAYKDDVIEANKTVNWFPSYVGEKRFGNWLENMVDWAISRSRYWGTPIPLWKCSCGHQEMIGSIEELKEKAVEEIKDIDLHRPYVDNIHIKCEKCGKEMTRIPEVMDCWFDSGAMPFASCHYPFENKDFFEKHFPADFICEGIDQTRGWFNSLLLISVFLKKKAPYKNVLVNDLVLAKDGSKMHKSRGNAVNPFGALEEFGADGVRWFFLSASPVWTPLRYDEEGVKEINTKMFSTLKNTYNFFSMYANIDSINPSSYEINDENLEEIDRWIISKYNNLIKYIESSMKEFDLTKVVKKITNFVNDDLSNWYIRRNRKRFWSKVEGNELSKKVVYKTTYNILLGLSKLIAPFSPFLAEEIYMNLTNKESVFLDSYPVCEDKYIDLKLEEKMDLVRDLITLGRGVRENSKIKIRQPLRRAILDISNKEIIGDLIDLIKEELNIKEIEFVSDMSNYMNISIKPNFKELGPKFGKNIKLVSDILSNLEEKDIKSLASGKEIVISVLGDDYIVNSDLVEVRVDVKENYNAARIYDTYIILDTNITKELEEEGIAREIISKIQNIRKTQDFNVTDRIVVNYNTNEELVKEAISNYQDVIKRETLSDEVNLTDYKENNYDINGYEVYIEVLKK